MAIAASGQGVQTDKTKPIGKAVSLVRGKRESMQIGKTKPMSFRP
jgi:hypothetical protein